MDSSWKQIVSKEKDYSLALFLCYLIRYCHRKYSRFTVGRKLICSKRFDDVLLEFEHEQKRTVLMFDIKQHRYRRWNSVTFVDNLLGCFKEYLKLRDSINTSTHKLIVWITDFTSKDDNLKSYQPTDDICDLLDSIEPSMGKYKLRKGSELEIELLKRVDPFYEVAERISRLLLKEGRITPFAIPQKIYDILLKNVFTENSFREDFILGNSPLPPEVKRFRENLECLLAQLLKHRNVHQFRLAKIGDHLPLMRFDFLKSVSVEASDELQKVESAASFEDIDKFFSLLIFYVCSSTVSDVRKLLKQKLDVEEQRELLQFQKVGSQLVEANVKQIFKWIDLKKQCTFELNDLLQFKGESLRPLKLVLSEYIREAKFNTLYISTCVDNNITLNRIMHLLKQYNYSDRVVIANKHSLHQAMDLIDIVNSVTPLMNNLPILILVGEDLTLSSSECLKVQNLNFLQIYVECGNKLGVGEDFCDRFRFSDLLDVIQNRLLMKPILLQEREVRLKNLLAKTCFEHISADELLDWAACYRPSIGSDDSTYSLTIKSQKSILIKRS
ncbi:uncharacterized protein LOC128741613 isoform X2 [Sabethes cyaneus]|uniref:uncharacterized protein LOC128741613 isoform X2 n=1 Tax=Sabethes cyaneus TaxID=53552 RepID=UPI00237DC800|nr:uncharacterized protein LOC128741613 isoform X2 [Sabethes cyaneus]